MVAFLEKSTGSAGFHQIIDFITQSHIYYALTKKPEVCVSFIKQFWRTAEILTDDNGTVKIHATIDGHSLSITEGSLRRHLKLDDQDGITSLPTTEIFAQLALMGYATDSDKLTFQKGAFSPQWRFLIHTILHCLSPKKTAWEQFSSNIAAAVICLATNRKFNFSRMIFDHMVSNISSPHKFLMYPRFVQLCLDMQRHKLQQHTRVYYVPSLTMKVFSNMKMIIKGFSGQEVALFPNMLAVPTPSALPSNSISSPEPTPSQPSPTQPSQPSPTPPGSEYHPPTPHDSPLHAVHSHGSDEGSLKLQELMNLINTLSDRIGVLEADLTKTKKTYNSAYTKLILKVKKLEAQLKVGKARRHSRFVLSDTEVGEDDSSKQGRKFSTEGVQDDEGREWKASDEISTAGKKKDTASEEVPPVSTAGVHISTAGETATYSRRSAEKRKDKGKGIMTDEEPKKKSKKEIEQERLSFAEAIRIEEQMHEEQRAQIARDAEIARQWEEEEKKRAMDEAKATKKIDWNDPSVLRYHSLKLKPKSIAQARRNMIKYLKNQGNFKMTDFKGMSYNEVRPIFEKLWDFNQKFVPLDAENASKKQKSPEKEKSPEKIMKEKVVTQEKKEEVPKEPTAKRKKSIPRKTTKKRQKLEDVEKDELKGFLDVVPREETPIEIESLSTKFPIVDWKTVVLTETFMYYQVFRGDGSSKKYKILSEMLQDFDRMDVEQLFRLVKERYSSSAPEGFDLMLWGDLHTLFEPDEDDEIWKDQHEYNLLSWRLHDFCGIHILLMNNGLAIHMLTEKKYPLSQEMLSKMLSTRLEVDHESSQAFELLRFIRGGEKLREDCWDYNPLIGLKTANRLKGLVLPAPIPSTSSPPVQSPPPIPTPIPTPTPTPTPIPETEPEPFEHTFESQSSVFSVDIQEFDSLETDLKQTKLTMGNALVKLVKKVKKLGVKVKMDPLDLWYKTGLTPSTIKVNASGEEQMEDISPNTLKAAKLSPSLVFQEEVDTGAQEEVDAVAKEVNTAKGVNTSSIKLSTVSEQVSTGNEQVSTVSAKRSTPSPDKGQRAGKAPMIIEETPKKAKIEANAELSKSMLGSDLQGEDFAKKMVDLINQRKKYFAEERARAKRNKPMTQSQLKTYMMNYLKNQGTWKLSQLKKCVFEEVKKNLISTKIPINHVPVAMKSPSIATYKIIKQGEKRVYQIVREDRTDIVYINFGAMLKDISRDDSYCMLYRIVMNDMGSDGPEHVLEIEKYFGNWSYYDQSMLDKKLQGGKLDENCYKMLKMMEKQAGIRK
ncbi:hypothetical protein Tco_0683575 [Tanacetum coccineum]